MLINRRKMTGASMIEYILGLSLLVIALYIVPVKKENCPTDMARSCGHGLSAIDLLEQSLKVEYSKYSESIASPR